MSGDATVCLNPDEPTAGLIRSREEILGEIKHLHEDRGITVILVTHSMEDVARLVDRLIVMEAGTIALDGTPVKSSGRPQGFGKWVWVYPRSQS